MILPQNPVILLSYINTQLRDFYPSLEEFCKAQGCMAEEICQKLSLIDYEYDAKQNQFV